MIKPKSSDPIFKGIKLKNVIVISQAKESTIIKIEC